MVCFDEQPLIKPHFAHEPVVLRMTDGTIAIWHIGCVFLLTFD